MKTKPRPSQWIALIAVAIIVVVAVLLVMPGPRREIIGRLAPVAQGESVTVRWVDLKDDHGELTFTASLRLENPGAQEVHPLGANPDLVLETAEGEWISPFTLPGEALAAGLRGIGPGGFWSGELNWWIEPEQRGKPLVLHWLDEELELEVDSSQVETEREVGRKPS